MCHNNKQTNNMNTAKIKEVIKNDEIAQKEIAITLIFIEMERLKAKGFSNELSLKLATINANQKFNFLFK